MSISIGTIKEAKVPIDRRVPLTPAQVGEIVAHFSDVKVFCQRSDIRCFNDSEYCLLYTSDAADEL